jgi:hypothetical protein
MANADAICRKEAEAVGNKYYGTWWYGKDSRGLYCWKSATKPSSVCTWSYGYYATVKSRNWVKSSRRLTEIASPQEAAMEDFVDVMDSADHEDRSHETAEEALEVAKYGQ